MRPQGKTADGKPAAGLGGWTEAASDPTDFVRRNTAVGRPPLVPEIALHLATEVTPIWQATEESLSRGAVPPPFWAFAWAGGQALARYLLDRPEVVHGRHVLDLASGSGLVAIAAARAGAASVEASEIDAFAIAAIGLNAALNGVRVEARAADLIGHDEGFDAVLAGDIFYDRDIAEPVTEWLSGLARRGATVLIGDPGRSYLDQGRLERLATYEVPVTRALEDSEVKKSSVWRFRP
ncbi:MAG: class I SAM-dependent methyltransferase [Microvirga sp.]